MASPRSSQSVAAHREPAAAESPAGSRWSTLASRAGASWRRHTHDLLGRSVSSGLTSLLVHACLVVAVVMFIRAPQQPVSIPLVSEADSLDPSTSEIDGAYPAAPLAGPLSHGASAAGPIEIAPEATPDPTETTPLPLLPETAVTLVLPRSVASTSARETALLKSAGEASELISENPPTAPIVAEWASGGGFEGRVGGKKGELLRQGGGTQASEAAVERGLKWLAAHQRADGSWNFNHQNETCNGYCRNPGTFVSTTAATGLALLPFLGAGNTAHDGEHRRVVAKGLYYLGQKMVLTPQGGDLQEGSMYGQGIASIALCEAYAMTKDESLRPFAQSALDFIISAQDPNGGGWRYTPGQPGDTTILGWQLMALKSGKLGGLKVPYDTLRLVEKFLDSVQTDYGAGYGYLNTEKRPTTTAVGLLARMYTGWPRNKDAIVRGAGYLDHRGPMLEDMYYSYYATQVLHHFGGQPWLRWNDKMREQLVATQARNGHEDGSWYFPDPHASVGGRLYVTSMAIMILEVYYRHMPLYGADAVGR